MTVTAPAVPGNAGHPLDKAPLPFWLREPCPPWCDLATPHHDSELYDDRQHSGVSYDVTLTVEPRPVLDGESYTAHVSAGLWMHYRESRPHVVLIVNSGEEVSLELDEAAGLARLLENPPGEWEAVTLSMMDPDAVLPCKCPGPGVTRAHSLTFPFTRPPVAAVRQVLEKVTLFSQARRSDDSQGPRYVDFTPAEAAELAGAITEMVDGAR